MDRIKKAYDRSRQPASQPASLLVDPAFAKEIIDRQSAWRRVVCLAINAGISPRSSLAYFDTYRYRRDRLPANLVQAQRDYLLWTRTDIPGSFHTEWFKIAKQSRIRLIKCNNVSTVTDKLEYHPINFWRQHLFIFIENVKSVNHIYSVYCICGCPTWFGILI